MPGVCWWSTAVGAQCQQSTDGVTTVHQTGRRVDVAARPDFTTRRCATDRSKRRRFSVVRCRRCRQSRLDVCVDVSTGFLHGVRRSDHFEHRVAVASRCHDVRPGVGLDALDRGALGADHQPNHAHRYPDPEGDGGGAGGAGRSVVDVSAAGRAG